ncbi:MAG: glycine zipper 2TM domain-containing protein [Steroidobacteraceae bacterium]
MNRKSLALLPLLLTAFAFSACGKKAPEDPAVAEDPAVQAQIDENEALTARQEEINRREAELALKEKEQELARREAALARSTSPTTTRPRPAPTPVATAPAPVPVASGPKSYTVPSGTSIEVQLPAAISTKTAKVGNRVSANLTNDLVVDGKVIARAGSLLQGSVTEVISGSKQIGGTPTLGLTFDNLTLADGSDTQVNGTVTQVAVKSDKGRDAAKIAGGAVAGAVIGHQVDGDKGKIIGGLLGAAAGTVAARKTGTEVELPAGTVIGFTLTSPVNVTM